MEISEIEKNENEQIKNKVDWKNYYPKVKYVDFGDDSKYYLLTISKEQTIAFSDWDNYVYYCRENYPNQEIIRIIPNSELE